MSAGQQYKWNAIMMLASLLGSLVVTKTSYTWVNWILGSYVTINSWIFIQSQRKLAAFPKQLRATAMNWGFISFLLGIYAFASMVFATLFVPAFVNAYITIKPLHLSNYAKHPVLTSIALISAIAITLQASYKAITSIQIDKLFFVLPRQLYFEHIFMRRASAKSRAEFAFIELAVVVYSFTFSSSMANTITNLIRSLAPQVVYQHRAASIVRFHPEAPCHSPH